MNTQDTNLSSPEKFKQVIVVDPTGSISGLKRKAGQGIDLREFGNAKIKRVTDIQFSETHQMYYIEFLLGELAGELLTATLLVETELTLLSPPYLVYDDIIHLNDYDDAVALEILFLDACRVSGKYPEVFNLSDK